MRRMEPILAYTSLLLLLCYLVALVKASSIEAALPRGKRSLGEFRPRNLVGALIQQLGIPHFYRSLYTGIRDLAKYNTNGANYPGI